MRIVLYEPLGQGGICHYTYELSRALSQRGDCRVTLVTPDRYELESRPRAFRLRRFGRPSRIKRLLRLGPRRRAPALPREDPAAPPAAGPERDEEDGDSSFFDLLSRVRRRVEQIGLALQLVVWRADVVHFQWLDEYRDDFLLRLLRIFGLPLVYTAHNLLPHEDDEDLGTEALARILRKVDRIIVHSESNRRELHALVGVEPGRVATIAHGSYELLLPEEEIGRAEARRRVGFPAQGPIVLFFGLIRRYKGLEVLLEAFGEVERRFPNARLAIVGQLLPTDDADFEYHSRLLAEASRRESVLRVGEYVDIDRVGLYFLAADVVVVPYTRTSHSGVLMAALAAGRPVVVTKTGAMPEVVEEGKTGFVVPPGDAAALAGAISRLLEKPEMAARMGREASEHARRNFSWDSIAGRTIDLYRSMAGAHAAAPATR
jgi:glycosyltransferase involved in cell wall biosynthesis